MVGARQKLEHNVGVGQAVSARGHSQPLLYSSTHEHDDLGLLLRKACKDTLHNHSCCLTDQQLTSLSLLVSYTRPFYITGARGTQEEGVTSDVTNI